MKITAIIPTFNRAKQTNKAIESVLSQTRPVDQIIIIDDASTMPFEFDHPMVSVIRHSENKGVSAARNTGLQHAENEWIAFLDSDDEWVEDKVEKQVKDIADNPNIKFFYTDETWLRGSKILVKKKHQVKKSGWVFKDCIKQCFIGASTAMIHKSVFDSIGDFDTKLTVCEDYDFWIRASLKFEIYLNNKELTVKYGGHDDQLSTKYFAMDYYRLVSLKQILKHETLNKSQKDLIHVQVEEKLRLLKAGALKHNNKDLLEKLNSKEIYSRIL